MKQLSIRPEDLAQKGQGAEGLSLPSSKAKASKSPLLVSFLHLITRKCLL